MSRSYPLPSVSKRMRTILLALLVLLGGTAADFQAQAAPETFTVNSAADRVNTGGESCDTGETVTSNGNEVAECTLRAAVQAANAHENSGGADTIVVPANTFRLNIGEDGENASAEGDLDITESVVINGAGADLTVLTVEDNIDRAFDIHDGDVTITGMTIKRGWANDGSGGAIRSDEAGGNLTVTGVVFDKNVADSDGGAIYVYDGGDLTLTDTTFTSNHADSYGGAIYLEEVGDITISGSTLHANSAGDYSYYGGVLYCYNCDSLTVGSSTVTDNLAGYGGAFYVETGNGADPTPVTFDASTFTGNKATDEYGGVLYCSDCADVSISSSTLDGNDATYQGGVLYCSECDAVDIANSSLSNNISGDYAGAIYCSDCNDTVTIASSTLDNNTADEDGGAIYCSSCDGGLSISNSSLSGNVSGEEGGAIYCSSCEDDAGNGTLGLAISGSTLDGNTAGDYGGAVYCSSCYDGVSIASSSLSGNVSDDDGGAIYCGSCEGDDENGVLGLAIAGSTLDGNTAEDDGGAVYCSSCYDGVSIASSSLSGNVSGDVGGAIYCSSCEGDIEFDEETDTVTLLVHGLTISDSTLDGNTAADDAGAIYCSSCYEGVSLSDSSLSGNVSGNYGGAIYCTNCYGDADGGTPSLTVSGSTLDGNTARYYGGAIYCYCDEGLDISSGSSLSGNISAAEGYYGGAVYCDDCYGSSEDGLAAFSLVDSVMDGNRSGGGGGGIYCEDCYEGPVVIDGSSVSRNVAQDGYEGGGLYCSSCDEGLFVTDSTLDGNTSSYDGGAVYCSWCGDEVVVSGGSVSNNTAVYDGGGLYVEADELNIDGTTLAGNRSTSGYGGAVYADGVDTTIDGATFDGNEAFDDGGAVYLDGYDDVGHEVTSSTFTANVSQTGDGGAIYNGWSYLDIETTLFEANLARFRGGAVYAGGDASTDIVDSALVGNRARFGGGLYNGWGDDATLVNSTFSGNYATKTGGAVHNEGWLTSSFVTVADNVAEEDGGGFHDQAGDTITLTHTLLAGNAPNNCGSDGAYDSEGHNLSDDASCEPEIGELAEGDQFDVADAGILPLADNGGPTPTHALELDSPAVDAGEASCEDLDENEVDTDQRGAPRPLNPTGDDVARCDIGAYEASSVVTVAGTANAAESGLQNGTFTVSRAGDLTGAISVPYTVGGTATSGDDYEALSGSVSFADGQSSATITVTPVNDSLVEADETVTVTLQQADASYQVGDPSSASIVVVSDDTSSTGGGGSVAPSSCTVPSGGSCTVAAGGTVRTGTEADADNPVVASVTTPDGGQVTITPGSGDPGEAPSGFSFFDVFVDIDAPDATAADPLMITFRIDGSMIPDGTAVGDIVVFRNGTPVADCDDPSTGEADPDPCVASRTTDGDDAVITVFTSQASRWNFGVLAALEDACPAGQVPDAGFTDVAASNTHADAIDCLAWWAITRGKTASTYAPFEHVSRGQMASFIARAVDASDADLPAGRDAFPDDDGSVHEDNINRLAAAGIVEGKRDGDYDPHEKVRRDQMASFLVRAYEYATGQTLTASRDYFGDDNGNFHEDNINAAREAGFTVGRTATTYAPTANVRRDQMASFITRMLDAFVAGGHATTPS